MKKKILVCTGTRADALKLAPLLIALKEDAGFDTTLLSTGQHREMCKDALAAFSLKADIDLDIMVRAQSLEHIEQAIRKRFPPALLSICPDIVLVHGDTASARFCAEISKQHGYSVAHIEAGIRSGDLACPYPEEEYRRYISSVADIHFAPTEQAAENLRAEGIEGSRIFTVGNTVIDALKITKELHSHTTPPMPEGCKAPYILLTCHRRESRGERARDIFRAAARLARDYPEYSVLFPIHKSEAVRDDFYSSGAVGGSIFVCEPLDYPSFIYVMENSYLIISDSGGVVEEAAYLGVPVICARDATDRPEAEALGCALPSGTDPDKLYDTASRLIEDKEYYRSISMRRFLYGDGHASERIVDILRRISL